MGIAPPCASTPLPYLRRCVTSLSVLMASCAPDGSPNGTLSQPSKLRQDLRKEAGLLHPGLVEGVGMRGCRFKAPTRENHGAEGETRTRTIRRSLAPRASASTKFRHLGHSPIIGTPHWEPQPDGITYPAFRTQPRLSHSSCLSIRTLPGCD